jgi:hypothetical protein
VSESLVYRIGFDVERYQSLLFDLPEPPSELFNGRPRASTWTPQPVYAYESRLDRPDIWHLFGAAVLVLDEEVVETLEPFVSMAGELLPLRRVPTQEELFALNVLGAIDCLAPGSWSDDDISIVPNFVEHRLPESGLLKVFPIDMADIFALERDDDEDSFRRRVERNGLRGLTFELVWSSSSGPVVPDLSV